MILLEQAIPLARGAVEELRCAGLDVRAWHIGGSTAIAGQGNDVDVVVLLPGPITSLMTRLPDLGYDLCGRQSYADVGTFVAYRRGHINLIILQNSAVYEHWGRAQAVCRSLWAVGVGGREIRVLVHAIVVDGEYGEYSPIC